MKIKIKYWYGDYIEMKFDEKGYINEFKSGPSPDILITEYNKEVEGLQEILRELYLKKEPLNECIFDYLVYLHKMIPVFAIYVPLHDFINIKKLFYKTKGHKINFYITNTLIKRTVMCLTIGETSDDIQIFNPVPLKAFYTGSGRIGALVDYVRGIHNNKWNSQYIEWCEELLQYALIDGQKGIFKICRIDNNKWDIKKFYVEKTNNSQQNKNKEVMSEMEFTCIIEYKNETILALTKVDDFLDIKTYDSQYYENGELNNSEFTMLWDQLKNLKMLSPRDVKVETIKNVFNKFKLDNMTLEVVMPKNKRAKNSRKYDSSEYVVVKSKDGHPNFSDVIGMDKIKERLNDVIHQFKHAEEYKEWDIEPIRAVLLYGPSGTGKSFIAEALANEIDATFIKYSASDIFHKYVGESEAAIRNLFDDAREREGNTVIFIDEIDAVANRRSEEDYNSKNSTLNELLVQMASSENEKIFMIFATNMINMLDPAFLRSGRVDFKIEVSLPDYNMRKDMLEHYSKKRPLDEDVDLSSIAKDMSGKNCADVKLVANEAARSALKEGKKKISQRHFVEAYEEMIVGLPDKNRNFELQERHITAVHEVGHLLANILLDNNKEIKRISILPRGSVLGFVHSEDKNIDKYLHTKTSLTNEIIELLAGRAAEDVIIGEISTGASNDLETANNIAGNMVMKYGMTDEFGFVINSKYDFISKEKATNIVREILDDCYKEAKCIIKENKEMLLKITEELENKEELNEADIKIFIDEINRNTYKDEIEEKHDFSKKINYFL